MKKNANLQTQDQSLFADLSKLIEQSRQYVATQANSVLTMLFWNVGKRINESVLQNKRAEYGKQIVATVSTQLENKYGRNFNSRNVRRMMQFAEQFPDLQIVSPLATQLSWTHFVEVLPIKSSEARMFYLQEAAERRLGKRDLRRLIDTKTFERTEIANLQISPQSPIPLNTFKDPYIIDFLKLPKGFLENDLENAILQALEQFILEMGKGFAFVERQKRMIIDDEDFYLDLLFYNRILKRLVAIELKLGKFQAKHKGQMELYLKWLNKHERQTDEGEPVGLILCAESRREQVELLELHKDGIMVAEYWTALPPKKMLEEKLREIVAETTEMFERKKLI